MKPPEKALMEWLDDEIVFDGGGQKQWWSCEQLERLGASIRYNDPMIVIEVDPNMTPFNPLAVSDHPCIPVPPGAQRLQHGYVQRNDEIGYGALKFVNWSYAEGIVAALPDEQQRRFICGRWLVQFASLEEAAMRAVELASV